ncbi:M1 family aminopeptidase [Cytophagales bacterium LB-30]|uniref:M1 family aminopeptidase n=1 Tax=Shiella aurantiaca TaxID=3058365 RepID=A0ABT8F0I6_9BACT|nr:M1 family aminopeptidase [Shiella aurantiaca]MDN4163945.1 M1 family aminopeptidase [Shiella aurantiaca]
MYPLLRFELALYTKRLGFYGLMLALLLAGVGMGSRFTLSLSPEVFSNSPYTVAYMTGFISLCALFFVTIFASQVIFREKESRFQTILYALPLRPWQWLLSKGLAVLLLSSLCLFLLLIGFAIGQTFFSERLTTSFRLMTYLHPAMLLGAINTLLCVALLSTVAWLSGNKWWVYLSGLMLYMLYMLILMYSNSPLMANAFPQSPEVARLSALLDPFGLSAYFEVTKHWSVMERNIQLVPLHGVFLYNRLGVLALSILALGVSWCFFRLETYEKRKKELSLKEDTQKDTHYLYQPQATKHDFWWKCKALFSLIKVNGLYLSKGLPFILTSLALLFYLGIEIHSHIEGGIRYPQRYASSALMFNQIMGAFPTLALVLMVYYTHELFWRSRIHNFHLIEEATPLSAWWRLAAQGISLGGLLLYFCGLCLVLGLGFQWFYDYLRIDWSAYGALLALACLPVFLSMGFMLLMQKMMNHKALGLVLTSLFALLMASPLGAQMLSHPMLRILQPYKGVYSEMNGLGSYFGLFMLRYALGALMLLSLLLGYAFWTDRRKKTLWYTLGCFLLSLWGAYGYMQGYVPRSAEEENKAQANYEKQFRSWQNLPQPQIKGIKTRIDLYPEEQAYAVSATYRLFNPHAVGLDSVLLHIPESIEIQSLSWQQGKDHIHLADSTQILRFPTTWQAQDSAELQVLFRYAGKPINGHESFNAIVENGSFMRISRYYPSFGYDPGQEITDSLERAKWNLGAATPLRALEAPRDSTQDFINLEMVVSTSAHQIPLGTGDLIKSWQEGGRPVAQFRCPRPVPFRFAVASAHYAVEKTEYQGIQLEVYYHPKHAENVNRLLENAKRTLAYCQANFGPYPFQSLRFAEVSSFTQGFAATAYPSIIFMTENMVFHANVTADRGQDLINELAGHEVAHMWWGTSQLAPDTREGSIVLTETLAMYTELMLVKQQYGEERLEENETILRQLYEEAMGFSEKRPLLRAHPKDIHLGYHKGSLVMLAMERLLGEDKVNSALKNLLVKHTYPHPKATSQDLVDGLKAVANPEQQKEIRRAFGEMEE